MLAVRYPTSPALSSSQGISLPAPKNPTSTTSNSFPVAIILTLLPFLRLPSNTLIITITPLYWSYIESNMSALSGAFSSPEGAGISVTIFSRTASIFMPFLADMSGASSAGMPMTSSMSFITSWGLALGRSILFMTGIISRSLSMARYTLARVCASIPWAASTTSMAPSQAARLRDTS